MRAPPCRCFREEEPAFVGEGTASALGANDAVVYVSEIDATGFAIAGRVREVGEALPLSWIGRRVAARSEVALAGVEIATVRASTMIAVPQGLSDREAVTLLVDGVAAYALLEESSARPAAGKAVHLSGSEERVGDLLTQLVPECADGKCAGAGLDARHLELLIEAWQRIAAQVFEDALAGKIQIKLPATSEPL